MSMSDPLSDMLTRIRNGQRAHKETVVAPASRLHSNVLDVLKREGYIRGFSQYEVRSGINEVRIELKYFEGDPVIREIDRVSKPGRRQTRCSIGCSTIGARSGWRSFASSQWDRKAAANFGSSRRENSGLTPREPTCDWRARPEWKNAGSK